MFERIWQGRLGGLRLIMILAVITLVLIGLVSIYATNPAGQFARKQLIWITLGIAAFIAVNLIH